MLAPRAPRARFLATALAVLLAASCGATSEGGDDVDRKPRLVEGVSIRDVALFQGLKIPLVESGAPVVQRSLPVLVGRSGVLRVYVDVAGDVLGREVTGELVLESSGGGAQVLTDVKTLTGSSSDADPASCFTFPLAGADVAGATQWQVRITDADSARVPSGQEHPARFPADGTSAGFSPVFDDAGGLNLVLVPVRYDTDGSGRLPDLTAEQLALYDAYLRTIYPLVNVTITVHDPIPFNRPDTYYGFDFDSLNSDLMDLRAAENVSDDVYYFGLVQPANTFNSYCGMGCVLGQSFLVNHAGDAALRVGAGVGFTGEEAAITLVHELGHQHGREHAPCDVPDPDPEYPYGNADTGVWGYDARTTAFKDPGANKDFMSYCEPVWTSDYTYQGIFDRILAVNALPKSRVYRPTPIRAALALAVAADGRVTPLRSVRLHELPRAGLRPARLLRADGTLLRAVEASLAPHGHGGTATLLVAEPPTDAAFLEVALADGAAPQRIALR